MGGRMYDPLVRTFLSPDGVVANSENTQNYNMYSYCYNNPLKFTDPTGWYPVYQNGQWYDYRNGDRGQTMNNDQVQLWCDNNSIDMYDMQYAQNSYAGDKLDYHKGAIIGGRTLSVEQLDLYDINNNEQNAKAEYLARLEDEQLDVAMQNDATLINAANGGYVKQAGYGEHMIGPTLMALGIKIKALKPVGALRSKPGSSIASYTLSKALPQTFTKTLGKKVGTKVATKVGTNVIGRATGRFVPYLGAAITAWDIGWNLGTNYGVSTWFNNNVYFTEPKEDSRILPYVEENGFFRFD